MLTTLLHPTNGSMLVAGFDPVKESDKVRHSFGIVFQDPSLDTDLTAYENLLFHAVMYNIPKKERDKRIKEVLKLVELLDRKDSFVKTFSGGMQRRLEIARSIIHIPKILFLDEPTIGLDPQTRIHIWQHMKKLTIESKMTVFLTTHYMEEAEKMADRIAIIDHGKIVAQGTVKELKSKTKTKSLEQAFLALTGHSLREEAGNAKNEFRQHSKLWGR